MPRTFAAEPAYAVAIREPLADLDGCDGCGWTADVDEAWAVTRGATAEEQPSTTTAGTIGPLEAQVWHVDDGQANPYRRPRRWAHA